MISLQRVTAGDFPLLGRWLAEPHVARWWNHETSSEALERDFGPASRGEEPCEDLLALADGEPVGLVQRCAWHDYPEDVAELAPVLALPAGAWTVDYLIGDAARTGRGLGPRVIRAAVEGLWRDHPEATCVVVPVVAANRASWRALERAGFTRVAEGELEPDNPIDDRAHVVYRVDRPAYALPQTLKRNSTTSPSAMT